MILTLIARDTIYSQVVICISEKNLYADFNKDYHSVTHFYKK